RSESGAGSAEGAGYATETESGLTLQAGAQEVADTAASPAAVPTTAKAGWMEQMTTGGAGFLAVLGLLGGAIRFLITRRRRIRARAAAVVG
ncbi:MAG: hypothetical protein ABWZ77_05685, partial [Naasia sp.]